MNILLRQARPLYTIYMHLKGHNKKINPKHSRLHLSYMDPKAMTQHQPTHPEYEGPLRKKAVEDLQRREFEAYKEKILGGKVDEEEVVLADPLWGEGEKPVHFYRFLSGTQVSRLSHSILKDVEQYQPELIQGYLNQCKPIKDISEVKEINDLADLAVYYRRNGIIEREKFYEIIKQIGNKFHKLTPRSLVLLKYAFISAPKQSTPEFSKILDDLLQQCLPQLSMRDLIHLMFFNRFDLSRVDDGNLQIKLLQHLQPHYGKLSQPQKIDFLFLYVESRAPAIRHGSHNRFHQQIRNKTMEIIYQVGVQPNLEGLTELHVLKLAYVLVRAKTINTQVLSNAVLQYVHANLEQIQAHNLGLLFVYLSRIEGGRSLHDLQKITAIKDKVLAHWQTYSNLNKFRILDAMYTLNLYDEAAQQLYTAVPIEASDTELAYICRLELMNSTGRQWEVIHRLSEISYIPLTYFQDYKRFCNYVSATAPDWDITCIKDKVFNTEPFYDALRLENLSLQKKMYRGIRKFQEFSKLKSIPRGFKMGVPIKNVEFSEFALAQYQICVDIISEQERVRGTRELKGSYLRKIRSLENIGWKQLYVFEEDVQTMTFTEFFEHIYALCEPHFQQQLKVIAAYEQYESYLIDQMREQRLMNLLKPRQIEQYLMTKDIRLVLDEDQEEELQKEKITTQLGGGNDQEKFMTFINEDKNKK